MPDNRLEKQSRILACAQEILTDDGSAGLTMRKLSERAGMRLSNVQYYFKTRDDVLKAMVAGYFEDCIAELRALTGEVDGDSSRDRAHNLILAGLRHGLEISDMCRIFREIWAISTRSDQIQQHMMFYYQVFSDVVADFILGEAADAAAHARVRSLLLPYFEGYSITAPSLPMQMEDVAEMLTALTMSVAYPPSC